jgi:hypothetical protein
MVDNRDEANANATSNGFNPKETVPENASVPDLPSSNGSICPKCGYPTREGEKKCPNCGASLTGDRHEPDSSASTRQVTSGTGGKIGGTVIAGAAIAEPAAGAPNRKLVGFLATYSTMPNGEAFNLYEGRNYIGRDSSADIRIQGDKQISGKHLSILYRAVDKKFKFRDEQSSNGTFVNEVLTDEGELHNFDIIRIGTTKFVFIAIPQQ